MKRFAFLTALLLAQFLAKSADARYIRGSVYLERDITTQFSSWGRARYINDLGMEGHAELSGTHSVNGPPNFETPVTGNDSYEHVLQGPAESGQCFTTQLHVVASSVEPGPDVDATFNGPETVCVVIASGPDGGSGGPIACSGNQIDPTDCNSPILIDHGRGGYQLSGSDDGVSFDIDADGSPDRITWTARNSGIAFLALDRNANGTIDDGSELFGNHTRGGNGFTAPNGFVALASFDANHDAIIDARDAVWPRLLLWTDSNHDGITAPSEVRLIEDAGIDALRLEFDWSGRRDEHGNVYRWRATLVTEHRGLKPYYDVYFRRAN